jgi:hypothetical protein
MILYRGMLLYHIDIEEFKTRIGTVILLNAFMSTTYDRYVALNFINYYEK